MELLNEIADLDIAPAAMAKVQALFEQQQAKLVERDAVLAEKDFKITALTHELAYYKRARFGKASEALAGEQRLLFDGVRFSRGLEGQVSQTYISSPGRDKGDSSSSEPLYICLTCP